MEEFKDRLKKLMLEHDKNPYRISKETGISRATISNYLSEGSNPIKIYTKILAAYFEVDPNWLQYGMKKKEDNSQES